MKVWKKIVLVALISLSVVFFTSTKVESQDNIGQQSSSIQEFDEDFKKRSMEFKEEYKKIIREYAAFYEESLANIESIIKNDTKREKKLYNRLSQEN